MDNWVLFCCFKDRERQMNGSVGGWEWRTGILNGILGIVDGGLGKQRESNVS